MHRTQDANADLTTIAAIDTIKHQPWVYQQSHLQSGTHPDKYQVAKSFVLNAKQQLRVLDGIRYGPHPINVKSNERNIADGTLALEPNSACIKVGVKATETQVIEQFSYSANGVIYSRTDTFVQLWIDRSSGLPVKAFLDGPELTLGRSLSRPGTPPQVLLKETGKRYTEIQQYQFNEALVKAAAAQ